MMTLTPVSQFANEQIFQTPYFHSSGIAVLVVTVKTYPVEGLYVNNQTLDVSIIRGLSLCLKSLFFRGLSFE